MVAGDHCYPEEVVFPDGVAAGIALTNRYLVVVVDISMLVLVDISMLVDISEKIYGQPIYQLSQTGGLTLLDDNQIKRGWMH